LNPFNLGFPHQELNYPFFSFLFEPLYTFTRLFKSLPLFQIVVSLQRQQNESIRTKPTSPLAASGHAVIFFQKLHLVTDRAFLQDFSELLEKKLKPKRNQIKTKCYSETFMLYLIEHPEATHFCLLTNMKKLEQIGRNGLKKLHFAG